MANAEVDRKIIEKIKKLIAFASDDRGNPHEIARAAAQAEAMLRKHNLEMTDVIIEELKSDIDAISESTVFLRYRKNKRYTKLPDWAQWISVRVAELLDCHCDLRHIRNEAGQIEAAVRFVGYHTDLVVCSWMLDFILAEVFRAAQNTPGINGVRAALSFRHGASEIICQRLSELKRQKDSEYAGHSTGTSLVVYKRAAIEAKFGAFKYGKGRRTAIGDQRAWAAGVEAGKKVNLTPGKPIDNPVSNARRLTN